MSSTTIYHVVRTTSYHSRKLSSNNNNIDSTNTGISQPAVYFVKKSARKRSIIIEDPNHNNINNNNCSSNNLLNSISASTSPTPSSSSSPSPPTPVSPIISNTTTITVTATATSTSISTSKIATTFFQNTNIMAEVKSITPDISLTSSPTVASQPSSPQLVMSEEEKRAELKQLLTSVIPCVMIGVESAENDITSIFTVEDLTEKRPSCQVLIALSKVLKEYPMAMGYIARPLPSCLTMYPKLREFRAQMDKLIWEIISKLSILREFVDNNDDVQKLYVVALSIRDAKNCFTIHECEHYIKSIDEIDPSLSRKLFASKTTSSPKPVLSRAPHDVINSTKNMVDSAIEQKAIMSMNSQTSAVASAAEEKGSLFRNLINQHVSLMKTNPQEYKKKLLQLRREKLEGSAEQPSSTLQVPPGSPIVGHPKRNSTDSPNLVSKSPDAWPNGSRTPVEKSRNSLTPPGKSGRSFSDPQIFSGDGLALVNPSIERISRHYKLQASNSPSSSSSNFNSLLTPPHLNLNADLDSSQEWDKYDQQQSIDADCDHLVQLRGFKTDCGNSQVKVLMDVNQFVIREEFNDDHFYKEDFFEKNHMNFLGVSKGADKTPMAVSICTYINGNSDSGSSSSGSSSGNSNSEMELLYIIRTQEGDERLRFNFPKSRDFSAKDMIKLLKKTRQQFANYRIKEIKEESILMDLLDFESKNSAQRHFKFGVLYCRDGQSQENEIYANHEPCSKQYHDFLQLLGERVELKGWKAYRGGLDIKDDMTGSHSIYRKWRNYEIMYHVATMIPYKPDDLQQIDRKRHLGNDIVVIIFKEGNTPLNPSIFKSNFNHIFAVVQVDENMSTPENTFYHFSLSSKDEITSFGPSFPKYYSFSSDELKEFLITKLTNGERWVLNSPVFSQKFVRTRREFLQTYINDYFEN